MSSIVKVLRVYPESGRMTVMEVDADKVYAVESPVVIPDCKDAKGETVWGYRIWWSPSEADCWWLAAESYNRFRSAFVKDETLKYVPVKFEEQKPVNNTINK